MAPSWLGADVFSFRRIVTDLRARQNIDTYALTVVVFLFAFLSIFSDVLTNDLRWAVLLSGLGLIIYQVTLSPVPVEFSAELLHDRSLYDAVPLSSLFANARDVRVSAPSAVNLLSAQTCEILRNTVLTRKGGVVRIVILDRREEAAVQLAARQLDDSLEFPVQRLPAALDSTMERLEHMTQWNTEGSFDYRLLPYNPGFSLVLLDPETPHGRVIVEIHAFHNPSTSSRMHLELTRGRNERWYTYWVDQFNHIWESGRRNVTPTPVAAPAPASVDGVEARE
jgi:hypothetical protein